MDVLDGMAGDSLKGLLLEALSENARKDSVIASQEVKIASQEAEIAAKEAEIEAKRKDIEAQQKVIETERRVIAELNELLRLRRARRYCPSTEQMECLFPELEATAGTPAVKEDAKTVEVKGFRRKKGGHVVATMPADTPVVVIRHDLDAPAGIVRDGITYARVADKVVDQVSVLPKRYYIERHVYAQYDAVGVEVDGGNRIVAYRNEKVDTISASPSLVAQAVVGKFDDHLPFYRQEEVFRREGMGISRQSLAAWIIKYYEALMPLERLMRAEVYASAFINKDETPVQVLDVKGPNGLPSGNGFAYITIGSTWVKAERATHVIALLQYIQGRSKEVLLEDLKQFRYGGPVMTDGLKGYLGIPLHYVCWVHAMRAFKDILKENKKEPNAKKLVEIIGGIYTDDEENRKLLVEGKIDEAGFLAGRKAASMPRISAFLAKIEETRGLYSPSGAMGKAIAYIDEYKRYLTGYLDTVEASPSNNCCERIAKSFATGRKNWLFAQTVDGADASTFFFSLVETAKLSKVSPSDYIEYVLTFGPACREDADWKAMLPWNMDRKMLDAARARRYEAKPDPARMDPYRLTGAGRK